MGAVMITVDEVLMGRDKANPLTSEQWRNLADLMARINIIRAAYGKSLVVSSGYRPPDKNSAAGGAKNSPHMSCQAVDFADPKGEFKKWCLDNFDLIKKVGLYMEDPAFTPTWVHLQTRPTKNNPFKP
jgi:uncharacterized protein YcbK (DUF882 family)